MNSAQLLRAIGDVDSVYVDVTPIEELIRKKKPIIWIKWCAVAACLALMAGCGWRIVFPQDNTPVWMIHLDIMPLIHLVLIRRTLTVLLRRLPS